MQIHTMQILNTTGDITIGWTEDQADMMLDIIEKKMKEGYTFFVKESDDREVKIKKISDLKGLNNVIIGDKEAELLIRDGKIGIVEVSTLSDDEITTTTRAKTAKEIASNNTVAVKPARGG